MIIARKTNEYEQRLEKAAAKLEQNGIAYTLDAPMARYTTFRAGGSCDLLIEPADKAELLFVRCLLSDSSLPRLIMGGGSNLLFVDAGYRGAVVRLANRFAAITVDGTEITAHAGARLSVLVNTALANGLTGLEFAAGIPGTVGGGVYMNAGAYGGELADRLVSVTAIDRWGNVKELAKSELGLAYRHSIFMQQNSDVIMQAKFCLPRGSVDDAHALINELNSRRRDKQPLEFPSAGSTFKRPKGHFAGQLIESAGLMGAEVGGAQVSQKHAGFIINTGGASAADIIKLIGIVKEAVYRDFGVMLEPEVCIIGEHGRINA